jgi:hypothetical protein
VNTATAIAENGRGAKNETEQLSQITHNCPGPTVLNCPDLVPGGSWRANMAVEGRGQL